jgi:hypothetical protein
MLSSVVSVAVGAPNYKDVPFASVQRLGGGFSERLP